ncbi:MAG: DUF192 domain-containing protein [Maricaulaceae bacterium]|nr:DUF192 domain-containing protein [Maricaulaceae bacterium]
MRALLSFLFVVFTASAAAQDPSDRDTVVIFGGPESLVIETREGPVAFTVELAETRDQLTRGLMWRESLADDAGMLFDFGEMRPQSMWMRNTLISLDLLFITDEGEIVKIIGMAQPRSLRQLHSDFPVSAVLEIVGGRAAGAGIRPGDIVRHRFFGNEVAGDAEPVNDAEQDADDHTDGGED